MPDNRNAGCYFNNSSKRSYDLFLSWFYVTKVIKLLFIIYICNIETQHKYDIWETLKGQLVSGGFGGLEKGQDSVRWDET